MHRERMRSMNVLISFNLTESMCLVTIAYYGCEKEEQEQQRKQKKDIVKDWHVKANNSP